MAQEIKHKEKVDTGTPNQGPVFINCPACRTENKSKARVCKRCGYDLTSQPLWLPTWKWHLKVLGIIYAVLIVAYFAIDSALRQLPPPLDIRDLPAEMTPWLHKKSK